MKLKLANSLSLPIDVVTQTIAILAKRRAGKSYTMRRLVEQLVHASQQLVLIDPKGDQWGVRSSADGKGPGLPLVILGGERADVPLEVGSGELVAKLVVEERVSAVLDLSMLRKKEVASFMTDFLENLYRLKAREIYRTPMMLVVDEADAIAPQKPMPGEERMLGAIEDIVRRGGQRGIGCTVVSQRSAVLNKNVLTQAQILVALRTIAPQDLKAMKEWIDVHGEEAERKVLMESLPSLPVGDAWFWSPGWPTTNGIFERVSILPIETFDSGATPKPGEKRREPKTVADIDLDALKRQMSTAIEKAKADDPRELKKQIAELQRQVKAGQIVPSGTNSPGKVRQALTDADRELLGRLFDKLDTIGKRGDEIIFAATSRLEQKVQIAAAEYLNTTRNVALDAAAEVAKTLERASFLKVLDKVGQAAPSEPPAVPDRVLTAPAGPRPQPPRREVSRVSAVSSNGHLSIPQQRILNALAWGESMRLPTLRREKVAFLADASPKSSAFMNNLGALRTAGYIDYPQQGYVGLTDSGRAHASVDDSAPTSSQELQDAICSKLAAPQVRIVREVVRVHPGILTREELAARAGASPSSSAYMNNLGALRSLGLIDYPSQGYVKANPVLFLEQ